MAEARAKLDTMLAELLEMSRRMAEAQAQFDAYRARPFWQRLVG